MNRRSLASTALLPILVLAACGPPTAGMPAGFPQEPPGPVEPLVIPDTSLVIDRPAKWWIGGIRGPTVIVSLIGKPDGYPAFAIHSDPEFRIEADEDLDPAIEELFESIVAGREENRVVFADWVSINGLRVHSSLMTFPSVAGLVSIRRLLFMHEHQPYILTWSTRSADWPQIETMVEWCVASLRLAPGSIIAAVIQD